MHINVSLSAPKSLSMKTLCYCSPSSEAEQNKQISEPCYQTYHRPKVMMAFYHVPVDSFVLRPHGDGDLLPTDRPSIDGDLCLLLRRVSSG